MVLNNPDQNSHNTNIWDTPGVSMPIKNNKMAENYILFNKKELQELIITAVKNAMEEFITTPIMGDTPKEETWTRKRAAKELGVADQTLSKMVLRGEIDAVKPGRKYKFLKSRIYAYLANKKN
jgi:excisionase family DNA binding protein